MGVYDARLEVDPMAELLEIAGGDEEGMPVEVGPAIDWLEVAGANEERMPVEVDPRVDWVELAGADEERIPEEADPIVALPGTAGIDTTKSAGDDTLDTDSTEVKSGNTYVAVTTVGIDTLTTGIVCKDVTLAVIVVLGTSD